MAKIKRGLFDYNALLALIEQTSPSNKEFSALATMILPLFDGVKRDALVEALAKKGS